MYIYIIILVGNDQINYKLMGFVIFYGFGQIV